MARKKFYATENKPVIKKDDAWRIALYIRLSREDGDKAESDSVVNQRKLLNNYVEEHDQFTTASFYIDEDQTGTNFNRPSFLRMLKQIEQGNVNCVIVKDLSRFGRDYIGAGKYLEHVFPKHHCRFISILDDLDSHINPDAVTGLMVRIKSLIHDQNSQDISIKVRATKNMQRKEGKYIAPLAPFGYIKNPDNSYHLIIDQEAAPIIEKIFDWYLSGIGIIRIAQKLNKLGIVTRSEYQKTKTVYRDAQLATDNKGWRPGAVRDILSNKAYIGALDQRRGTTRNYKDRKYIPLPEEEHIIVYDTHEPIISRVSFDEVQHTLQTRCARTSQNEERLYPFSGLLRCGDCHYAMIRNRTYQKGIWYVYYKCRVYNQRGTLSCNHSHSIREDVLTDAVLATINLQIKVLINIKCLVTEINNTKKEIKPMIDYDRLISEKEKKRIKIQNLKVNSYSDWKNGEIDKQDYLYMKDKYDSMIKSLNDEITALEDEKESFEAIRNNQLSWIDDIVQYGTLKELNRDITASLIDVIYVHQNKQLDIVFKFDDEYKRLQAYINDNGYSIYSGVSNAI